MWTDRYGVVWPVSQRWQGGRLCCTSSHGRLMRAVEAIERREPSNWRKADAVRRRWREWLWGKCGV